MGSPISGSTAGPAEEKAEAGVLELSELPSADGKEKDTSYRFKKIEFDLN